MRRLLCTVVATLALVGCGGDATPGADSTPGRDSAATASAVRFDAQAWRAPTAAAIPDDSMGASIRRGLALITHTPDSLPAHAPGRIACTNCHLDGGRNVDAAPLTGAHARYPKYMERTGAVVALADRINYCFTRSLAGTRIPADSREMQDILAYIAWLSRDVPVGARLPGSDGLPPMPQLVGDATNGAQVFVAKCQSCHGQDGQGIAAVPALWGPRSFSIGASMSRQSKAASFIWHNMPLGQGKSLTPQEAFDVAAYVVGQPRLDSPGKERDWPSGGAPKDVPYATREHEAFRAPRLLPRPNPAGAIVTAPRPVASRGDARTQR